MSATKTPLLVESDKFTPATNTTIRLAQAIIAHEHEQKLNTIPTIKAFAKEQGFRDITSTDVAVVKAYVKREHKRLAAELKRDRKAGKKSATKTTQKKKSSADMTKEELAAILQMWADDNIEVAHTKKAVESVLRDEFGDDFSSKDVLVALNLLKNPPIDIDTEARNLVNAISSEDLEFTSKKTLLIWARVHEEDSPFRLSHPDSEYTDEEEIGALAFVYHKANLKLAKEEAKEEKETDPESIVYAIGEVKDVNYVHPAQHFDRETGEAWFGFQMPLSATDEAGKTKTEDVHMLVTLGKQPIPCIPKFLKMGSKRLSATPYSVGKFGNRMSNECLNAISTEHTEHTEHTLTPFSLFLKNKSLWKELVWFRDDRWHDFLVLWTFGTYLHRLFAAYPYLHMNGPRGSAKSRVAEIISLTGFNGELSPNLTPASLFRTVESCAATLCLDEMEMLGTAKELFHDIRSMLLHGYKAGGMVKRTEVGKDGELRQVGFSVYSPKLIGNIEGLDDVLEDRCIPIRMQRLSGSKLKPELKTIVNRIVRTKKRLERFQEIRDNYYMLVYKHWQRIDELYTEAEEAEDEKDIAARHLELWFAILTLAKFFDECEGLDGIEDRMRGLIQDVVESYRQKEADSNEHTLISTLWGLVKDKTKEEHPWLSYKEIRQAWANHLKGWPRAEMEKRSKPVIPEWMTPRYTGKMFRNKLNYTNKELKRTGKGGGWHAKLTKDHIQELITFFDVNIDGESVDEEEPPKGGYQGKIGDNSFKNDPPIPKHSSVSSVSSVELKFLGEHMAPRTSFEPAADDLDIVDSLLKKGCFLEDDDKMGSYRITKLGITIALDDMEIVASVDSDKNDQTPPVPEEEVEWTNTSNHAKEREEAISQ